MKRAILVLCLSVISLLSLGLLRAVETSAQVNPPMPTPTAGPLFAFDIDVPTQPQLITSDRLAPGCELTSAEAGVYRVECEQDPGTTSIPTIDGELMAQGCELINPETGVFVLDCTPNPVEPAVPGLPGEVTIPLGSIGDNTPTDRAPQAGVCDGAAESYLQPGMEVVSNLLISLDNVVYNNQDEELALNALYTFELYELGLAGRRQYMAPDDNTLTSVGDPFQYGDVFTLGTESTCVTVNGVTVRLWRLETSPGEGISNWVIETVAINYPVDLTEFWANNTPNQQNPGMELAQPQFPVLVDGVVFRYLMPYVEPPIITVPSADQIDSGESACEGTPPSFLSIGMDVMLDGYGYTQFPQSYDVSYLNWTFDNTRLELGQHGFDTYTDILNTTPLTGIVGNIENVMLTPQELYSGTREATIIGGPFCVEESVDPPINTGGGITEASDPAPERFSLWWQIEVNGQVGYYPENVGQFSWWLWEQEGIFPRKLSLYYMQPIALMTQPQSPSQDTVAPPVSEPTQLPPPTIEPIRVQPTQVLTMRPTQAPPTATVVLEVAPPAEPTTPPRAPSPGDGDCSLAPVGAELVVGEFANTNTNGTLSMRTNLTDEFPSNQIPGGLTVTVLNGPVCNGGFRMWQVSLTLNGQNVVGWLADGIGNDRYLRPGPARSN